MVAGRQADLVVLSDEDRSFLEGQVRRHKAPRSLSDRCRLVLLCAEGLQSKEVAARLGVHEHTVGKWRRRFATDGIEGLSDEYRVGRPRTEQVAATSGLSHNTIRRIWNAFGLQASSIRDVQAVHGPTVCRQAAGHRWFLHVVAELEADITAFITAHNENPKPYKWIKSADQTLASVKRFCQKTMNRTSDSDD